jgi:predicted aldo/keto reductase-like oxidoreductase
MDRRDFIKKAGLAAGAVLSTGLMERLSVQTAFADEDEKHGDMIFRTLGRTGEKVSVIGAGGFHIGKNPDEGFHIIRSAIERGVTFMDNSWDYNGGNSEITMGKALRDGYRQKVFLMTKIDGRTKEAAAQQIDESLKRLQTDVVDLLQIHEVIRMEDPDRCFADDGAIHALLDARKAGKLRFIGFTGHKDPAVHLRMLEVAAENGFRFDTVQMPLNVLDAHFRSFEKQVLPILVSEQIGVLGMKSMGDGFILQSKAATPIECLHYAINLPTSTVITGIDSMEILDQALEAVRTFKPMSVEEVRELLARTAEAARKGKYEPFKTSNHFDSTAHNPQWLG